MHQVAVAAGRDDTLPVLTGIRIEIDGDTVTLAATDRYRLAVRELAWSPEQTGLETVALVPARTLADTAKALAGCESVDVALARSSNGEGLVGFDGGGRRTTTRLLEGEFPKYRSLLPTESASVADVDTGALVEAVKRVALVAERNTPVRLTFAGGELQLRRRHRRRGAGERGPRACSLEGESVDDRVQPAVPAGRARRRRRRGHPALVHHVQQAGGAHRRRGHGRGARRSGRRRSGGSYRYLLMPVRLSG